jgi:hypothetical protein
MNGSAAYAGYVRRLLFGCCSGKGRASSRGTSVRIAQRRLRSFLFLAAAWRARPISNSLSLAGNIARYSLEYVARRCSATGWLAKYLQRGRRRATPLRATTASSAHKGKFRVPRRAAASVSRLDSARQSIIFIISGRDVTTEEVDASRVQRRLSFGFTTLHATVSVLLTRLTPCV